MRLALLLAAALVMLAGTIRFAAWASDGAGHEGDTSVLGSLLMAGRQQTHSPQFAALRAYCDQDLTSLRPTPGAGAGHAVPEFYRLHAALTGEQLLHSPAPIPFPIRVLDLIDESGNRRLVLVEWWHGWLRLRCVDRQGTVTGDYHFDPPAAFLVPTAECIRMVDGAANQFAVQVLDLQRGNDAGRWAEFALDGGHLVELVTENDPYPRESFLYVLSETK